MLATQVQYWSYVEGKRHNVETEKELNRHNVETERETNRHNLQQEDLGNRTLQEQVRHNMTVEIETTRHNVATEQLGYAQLGEQIRHNTQTEYIAQFDADTRRAQLAINWAELGVHQQDANTRRFVAETNYSLGLEANTISQQNADTNRMNAETSRSRLGIERQNADTNLLNAMTRNSELNLERDKLELEKEKWKLNSWLSIFKTSSDVVHDLSSSMTNILQAVPAVH